MTATIFIALLAIIGIVGFIGAIVSKSGEGKAIGVGVGVVTFILAFLLGIFSMVHIVPDGHVGVTRTFGEYGEDTLAPGIQVTAPWTDVVNVSTQTKEFTFSNGDNGNKVGGAITAQAQGGGNLTYDMTVQYNLSPEQADEILRQVGSNWEETVLYPPARSCGRDATGALTVEQAFTSGRSTVSDNNFTCLSGKVEPYGITITDVLIREVDPGEQVRASIDAKIQAEQDVQRAEIRVAEAEAKAREEAVRAFGISNAEQIVACGGVEGTVDGIDTIIPNETCEDQFSPEYLQWLYINQLSEVDGVVILPPEFDGELFIQTPQPPSQGG